MKKASPIGIPNEAQISSGSSKSSSQTTGPGRAQLGVAASAAPGRSRRCRGSAARSRCSRWRWSAASALPQRSQTLGRRAARRRRRRRCRRPAARRSRRRPATISALAAGGDLGVERLAHRRPRRAAGRSAQRHPRAAGAVEQRHRLEQQPLVVERAPGARQEEAALAGRAGRASPSLELAAGERAAAAGAGSRKASSVPSTRATISSTPVDARGRQLALGEPVGAVEVEPRRRLRRRRCRRRPGPPAARVDPAPGAAGCGDPATAALDHQALEVGRAPRRAPA